MNTLQTLPYKGSNYGPDDRKFPWGAIVTIHRIGEYQIVEFLRDYSHTSSSDMDRLHREHGKPAFHSYINNVDTGNSADTLDDALIICISIKHEGANTRAPSYFRRMIGDEIYPGTKARYYRHEKEGSF